MYVCSKTGYVWGRNPINDMISCETRKVVYTCRYISGHVIPNSVMAIEWRVEIRCPLVYLCVAIGDLPCFTSF